MLRLVRTTSVNPHFISLVALLDTELAHRDGADHSFYAPYNKIDQLNHVIVAYEDEQPVACGALKPFDKEAMEVKRMFTQPQYRGRAIAAQVLQALELWARELGYTSCVLETGKRQPEAVRLYQKSGYQVIPNYGQYAGIENSLCFRKMLGPSAD